MMKLKVIILLNFILSIHMGVGGQSLMSEAMDSIYGGGGFRDFVGKEVNRNYQKNSKNNSEYTYKLDSVLYKEYPEAFPFPITRHTTFHYDDNSFLTAASSNAFDTQNQLVSFWHTDYTYTSSGQLHEMTRYSSTSTFELRPYLKESFSYDSIGNLVEETLSNINTTDNQWFPVTTFQHTYDSQGRRIRTVSISHSIVDANAPFYESIFTYHNKTGRLILTANFNFSNGLPYWDNKLDYTYNDIDNSYTEIQSEPWPNSQGTSEWTPFNRQDYSFNSQNKIIDHNRFQLYPSVHHSNNSHHEYDESFNLIARTNTINPGISTEFLNYKERFEYDYSVSAEEIFIPELIREQIYGFDIFNSKCEKKHLNYRADVNNSWLENFSDFTFYYSKFNPGEGLEEGTFIYPNPASDVLNTIYPANTSFKLYNTLGQIVFETVTTIDNQVLNLPSLVTGVYIYKSSIDEGRVVIR